MYLAHLEKLTRTHLEDVLVEEGIVDRANVEDAQAEQEQTGKQLGEILIEREILTDYDLAKLVAAHYALPFLDVTGFSTRREVLELLPSDFCLTNALLPLDQFGTTLTLAVSEMPGSDIIDDIVAQTKLTPFFFIAVRRALMDALAAEKKRGPRTPVKGAPAPSAPAKSAPPRPAAAPMPTRPAHAAPAAHRPETDSPAPDLNLPQVSMKLVGGAAGRGPPAPARPPVAREPAPKSEPVAARPAGAPAPARGAAAPSGGALSWMDAMGGQGAGQSAEAPRPKISRFQPTGGDKHAAPPTGPAARGATPAPRAPAPAASAEPAKAGGGGGAWQSIFDVGEESVRKDKPK